MKRELLFHVLCPDNARTHSFSVVGAMAHVEDVLSAHVMCHAGTYSNLWCPFLLRDCMLS